MKILGNILLGLFAMILASSAARAEPSPPVWGAYESNWYTLVLISSIAATPSQACDEAVQYEKTNYWPSIITHRIGTFEEAIPFYIGSSNSWGNHAGYRCEFDVPDNINGGEGTMNGWNTFKQLIVKPLCNTNQLPATLIDGRPYCSTVPPVAPPPCDCEAGDTPLSAPSDDTVGNPIAMDNGEKRQSQIDYGSADGLFQVERTYRSAKRDPRRVKAVNEIPGFGDVWHGLIPGRLTYSVLDQTMEFSSDSGSIKQFSVTAPSGPPVFSAIGSTRLKATYIGSLSEQWANFVTSPATSTGSGDIKLSFSNGAYILFRKSGSYDATNQVRNFVAVERGEASGYKVTFVYPDTGEYPSSQVDSFGRTFGISWVDIGWAYMPLKGYHKGPQVTDPGSLYVRQKAISGIALPDGSSIAYSYSASEASGWMGRLSQVARNSGTGTAFWGRTYVYEDTRFSLALTGILDLSGSRLSTYAYDASGRTTLTEHSGGYNHFEVAYGADAADGSNRTRQVTNPLGLKTDYIYSGFSTATDNPSRLLSKAIEPSLGVEAATVTYAYDSTYNLTQGGADARGYTTTTVNDTSKKRPTSMVLASGTPEQKALTLGWHATFDLPLSEARTGLTTSYTYNSAGQMLTRSETDTTTQTVPYSTNAQKRTWTYTWDTNGRLTSINGPKPVASTKDDKVTFVYDTTTGNLLTETNGLAHVTTFASYDANGRPGTMTDPNGIVTAYTYDALGRATVVAVKYPADATKDAVTAFEYDAEGRVIGLTSPQTDKLIVDYDLAGRITAIRAASGERIDYTTNAMGGVTGEVTKRANGTIRKTIVRTFDGLNRMLTLTLGTGRMMTYSYDKSGNPTKAVSARSNATDFAFDGLSRLTSTIAPGTATSSDTYDAGDDVITHTDPISVQTTYVRNGFGDIIQETSPDRGTTIRYYDLAGDVTAIIDGRSQRVDITRDILGRITKKTPVGRPTSEIITYTYDTGGVGSYQIGRLTKIVDGSGTTSFQYDHRGNVLLKRQTIGTTVSADLSYAYDLADHVTKITYPSGRVVDYARDSKGRVSSVKTRPTAAGAETILVSGMTYEAFGSLLSGSFGNGLALSQSWGDDGRLANKRLYRTSDSTNLSMLSYGYDNEDNITSINDGVDATRNVTYAYDATNRLNQTVAASGTVKRQDFIFDKNGNRITVEDRTNAADTAPAASTSYALVAGKNRLASVTSPSGARSISYDGRGNTSGETRPGSVTVTTAYDGYSRLTSYQRTGTSSLTTGYNGLDDRISQVTSTDTRRFVSDGDGRLLGEYGTSATDVKAETIWLSPETESSSLLFGGDDGVGGYAPLAVVTGGSVYWAHGNHLGVPVVLTNASGTAATPTGYTRVGFPGQTQTLNDLYYNRYRDYDPTIGRYIQADPIGLAGGQNIYAYVGNNPTRWMDPNGLKKVNLFDPSLDPNLYGYAERFRDRPGLCIVFGHMNPNAVRGWGRRTRDGYLDNPQDIHNLLMKRGCKPTQPVLFFGCQAGKGSRSIADQYAKQYGVPTMANDRDLWWSNGDLLGAYGRQSENSGSPDYNFPNQSDPGVWRLFKP
ncbi:MAG TPA: RHS repeat-associated core domain-containing protein [Sphingobium sp.]